MEATEEGIESFDEWEQVQLVNNPQHYPSVIPPNNHQGLQVPSPSDSQTSTQPSSGDDNDAETEEGAFSNPNPNPKEGNAIGNRLRLRLEIFRSAIVWITSRTRGGGGLWSFASVSLIVAAAVLLYSRVQRWRQWLRVESQNRLILVIKEKDQKINQLMVQMAQMNEMLNGPRKVAVVRNG